MFFFLSKTLDIFLSPLSWAIFLIAASFPWTKLGAAQWSRRRWCFGLGILILVVSSSLPVANGLTRLLEQSAVSTYRPDVVYDAVILLGGMVDEEATLRMGQPSYNDNVERLVMTYKLLREGKAKVAILSSAAMDARHPEGGEALVLGRQLEEWGIAKERIVIEDRARNTHENAVFSQEIVRAQGYRNVLIVTSAYHMVRSRECFAAVPMDVDSLAVDYRAHASIEHLVEWLPRASSLMVTSAMLREMAGRYIYRVQGYGKAVP